MSALFTVTGRVKQMSVGDDNVFYITYGAQRIERHLTIDRKDINNPILVEKCRDKPIEVTMDPARAYKVIGVKIGDVNVQFKNEIAETPGLPLPQAKLIVPAI